MKKNSAKGLSLMEFIVTMALLAVVATFAFIKINETQQFNQNKVALAEITATTRKIAHQGNLLGTLHSANFGDYMLKYMNPSQTCQNDALAEGCAGQAASSTSEFMTSFLKKMTGQGLKGAVLVTGATVYGLSNNCDQIFGNPGVCTMVHDANGPKGPNMVGQDIQACDVAHGLGYGTPPSNAYTSNQYGWYTMHADETLCQEPPPPDCKKNGLTGAWDDGSRQCICQPSKAFPNIGPDMLQSGYGCKCEYAGEVALGSGNGCHCQGTETVVNGACGCSNRDQSPDGGHICRCPSNKVPNGSNTACVCPSGMNWNGNRCVPPPPPPPPVGVGGGWGPPRGGRPTQSCSQIFNSCMSQCQADMNNRNFPLGIRRAEYPVCTQGCDASLQTCGRCTTPRYFNPTGGPQGKGQCECGYGTHANQRNACVCSGGASFKSGSNVCECPYGQAFNSSGNCVTCDRSIGMNYNPNTQRCQYCYYSSSDPWQGVKQTYCQGTSPLVDSSNPNHPGWCDTPLGNACKGASDLFQWTGAKANLIKNWF